jgi:hypothetical protein
MFSSQKSMNKEIKQNAFNDYLNHEAVLLTESFKGWRGFVKYFAIFWTHLTCVLVLVLLLQFRLCLAVYLYLIFFLVFYQKLNGDSEILHDIISIKE